MRISDWSSDVCSSDLLKLLVQPAITWLLAYHFFTMEPVWAAGALIQSALPTGALVFVLAQQYGIYLQRSTAAIMASTVVSLLPLSALFVCLEIGRASWWDRGCQYW